MGNQKILTIQQGTITIRPFSQSEIEQIRAVEIANQAEPSTALARYMPLLIEGFGMAEAHPNPGAGQTYPANDPASWPGLKSTLELMLEVEDASGLWTIIREQYALTGLALPAEVPSA